MSAPQLIYRSLGCRMAALTRRFNTGKDARLSVSAVELA
jgi:hypothetical protein